mmetsp:Transcript_1005/g.3733  ORF Transcript_1005/g.3733 Transcript_1005/m.3733 type:complete len:252 (+) Transcript_1005:131-886(+)
MKRGQHHSEFSCFRYNVTFRKRSTTGSGAPPPPPLMEPPYEPHAPIRHGVTALERRLQRRLRPEALLVTSVPDARLPSVTHEEALIRLLDPTATRGRQDARRPSDGPPAPRRSSLRRWCRRRRLSNRRRTTARGALQVPRRALPEPQKWCHGRVHSVRRPSLCPPKSFRSTSASLPIKQLSSNPNVLTNKVGAYGFHGDAGEGRAAARPGRSRGIEGGWLFASGLPAYMIPFIFVSLPSPPTDVPRQLEGG